MKDPSLAAICGIYYGDYHYLGDKCDGYSNIEGEPFTRGIYRYLRNAISLGTLLVFIGICIATSSWLYLLLTIALLVINYYMIVIEE